MEYTKVDRTTSRHLPIIKWVHHDLKEEALTTMSEPYVIEGIKQAISDGDWGNFPLGYHLCFFREEKEGSLDMFPLPLLLDTPDEKLPSDWLRYCKFKLEEALYPPSD